LIFKFLEVITSRWYEGLVVENYFEGQVDLSEADEERREEVGVGQLLHLLIGKFAVENEVHFTVLDATTDCFLGSAVQLLVLY